MQEAEGKLKALLMKRFQANYLANEKFSLYPFSQEYPYNNGDLHSIYYCGLLSRKIDSHFIENLFKKIKQLQILVLYIFSKAIFHERETFRIAVTSWIIENILWRISLLLKRKSNKKRLLSIPNDFVLMNYVILQFSPLDSAFLKVRLVIS